MAKKCKDCDPNKYIEGLAYRGKNGYSFDQTLTYNDIGQPYVTDTSSSRYGKPTTDMLANVQDMLDAYNPIFSSNSVVGLPPSVNNRVSVRGIDAKRGFSFIWSFVDGLIAYANPGERETAAAITSQGVTSARKGAAFSYNITTDQVPSSFTYSGFDKISDKGSADVLRFSPITSITTPLIKDKINYVGYHTGYITSSLNYGNKSLTAKKSLTIKSLSSDVTDSVYAVDANANKIILALPLTLRESFLDVSQRLTGSTSIEKQITNTNTVLLANLPAKSNGYNGAAYFDGTAKLSIPADSSFSFGSPSGNTNDFTIEWWQYWDTISGYQVIYSNNYSSGLLIITGASDGRYRIYFSGTQIFSETTAAVAERWYHYALVRNGTTVTIYRDGVPNGSATTSLSAGNASQPVQIGDGSGYTLKGYVQDFRVYKGVAKYTSTFTPSKIITTEGNSGAIIEVTSLPTLAALKTKTITGTYSQSGTTITVTSANHGRLAGESVYIKFDTGSAVSKVFSSISTVLNSTTFTVSADASLTTSGICSISNPDVDYTLTTNLPSNKFTATLEQKYIDLIRSLGLEYDQANKKITGIVSSALSDELKSSTITFNLRADIDADAGNATQFTLNIIYGAYISSAAKPTITNYTSNWTVGKEDYISLQGVPAGEKGSKTGTYSQSGTTITVTSASHGKSVNQSVYINFTTGGAVSKTFSVVTATSNTFTVTADLPLSTSGDCTISTDNPKFIVGIVNLPEGLSYNSSNDRISGKPIHAGTFIAYASVSNNRGNSDLALYRFNIAAFEEDNRPSGTTKPSVIQFLQSSFDILKNNKITLRLNPVEDSTANTGSSTAPSTTSILRFKRINRSEFEYIKKNNEPQPFSATYTRDTSGRVSITINSVAQHNFGPVGRTVSLSIKVDSGGATGGDWLPVLITGDNTLLYTDTKTTVTSGNMTIKSFTLGPVINEVFTPGRSRDAETSFWISLQDPNLRVGQNTIGLDGGYDVDYSSLSVIDTLGNACFPPDNNSDGPVSTPINVPLDVIATGLIKNAISANAAENVPNISFNPGPNIEHQIVFSSLALAEGSVASISTNQLVGTANIATSINQWQNLTLTIVFFDYETPGDPSTPIKEYSAQRKIISNTLTTFTLDSSIAGINPTGATFTVTYPFDTTSTFATQRLSKTNLLKYPYGVPAANGTYYFYVNFTDTCAFNNSNNLFTFYVGTYTPRIGDVYSCYYWYTPAPPRSYKGRCFPAGTKIYTPQGNIDIRDIKVDQEVYAFDEDRNLVKSRVVAFLDHDLVPDKIYKITLENDQYIRANHEHPFLNGDGDFVAVSELKIGDELVTFHDKKLKIISIEEDGFEPVYNIEVEKYHTYIAENLFVHNRYGSRPRQVKAYQNVTLTSSSIPGNCDGGVVSRIGESQTYKSYGYQYRNTLLESKDIGITSLTNISILDVLGEGPIEGIVDYEIKPKPGYKKGDIGYLNGVDLIPYRGGSTSFIRSIYWNETPLADNTYDDPGSVNFEFIKLKFDNGSSAPRHADIRQLSDIKLEEEFYSKKILNGAYINSMRFVDQNENLLAENIKLPKRLTSTKTVGTKLAGKRVFQDGTEKTYKKSINILTKDLYAIKLHIKAISLFKQIVDLRIFDSAAEAEENSEGGRIDRQSMTFNLTLKRIDRGSNSEGLFIETVNTSELIMTGRLNSGPYIETFEWSGLNHPSTKVSDKTIGWEIEIEPTYVESIDANIVLKSAIDSITEVYNEFLILPHTAGILTTFDARFFTNIPQRAYDVRMLKVKIPSNYNPFSKTYNGIWDGRFKLAWTDNPPWCFYDLLTNRRYGLGKYVDPQFTDKWTLYEIGKYCDELVSDGKGGLEPRFTCNVLISTREDAYKVVNDMASIFRAIVYYNAGLIVASQDRPKEPIYIFNNSNVKDGEFTYSNTSKRVRRNIALVRYNDKDNFYKPAVKYVESRDGLIRYGIRETEVSAFGCTSEGQAERLGKWTLLSENFESELVSFETTLPGMYLKPGDIILIQDQNRQNKVLGGRTFALNRDSAILDIKYENLSGYLPVISGCKFNILTPAGNIELSNESGEFINGTGFQNTEFTSYGGEVFSGLSPSIIRRKQIQTINYNVFNAGQNSNVFSMYVSQETGQNYDGYTRINFGGQLLDDKDHTLLQNTVWTIEIDPASYNYGLSPSASGFSNTGLYPGAYLEPYIDKTQRFRILDIEEQEEYRYKITALQYEEAKYAIGDDI